MTITDKKLKASLALLLLVVSVMLATPHAYAEDEFSLGVFPPIYEMDVTPPSLVIQDLSLQNFTEKELVLNISVKPFRPSTKSNGEISFDTDRFGGPDQLIKQKISVLEQERAVDKVTLSPLETKKLHLSVDIKQGDPAGDYYFSIVFLADTTGTVKTGATSIPGGVATNVLLTVGPKGPVKGAITRFSTPTFLGHGPVPFSVLVKNNSNHFIEPTGTITIENMFGQQVGKVSLVPQAVLSNSDRYLIDTKQLKAPDQLALLSKVYPRSSSEEFKDKAPIAIWPEEFLLGFYTAKLTLSLSENGPLLTSQAHFFAIPLFFLIGLIGSLIITLGIYLRVRKRRKITR